MKREKTPPPTKRPGKSSRSGPTRARSKATATGTPDEPDMTGWSAGEVELYRLAISQGKRPVSDARDLAYGTTKEAEQLLATRRQLRAEDGRARLDEERRSSP